MADTGSILKGQGVALLATALALVCRFVLDPALGEHLPYVTFFVAVAFSMWYAGLASSLTTTLLGGLAALWFFVPPRLSLDIADLSHRVGLVTYAAVSLALVGFGQMMHRARLRAEDLAQSLRVTEERLNLAQQASQVGSFDYNLATGIHTWSSELYTMYGIAPNEFGNTQAAWERYLHPEDREGMIRAVEQSRTSGGAEEREFRIVRPNGEIRWVVGRWRWLKDPAGRPIRLTGVNIDITERKRTADVLLASERAAGHLAAIVKSSDDAIISKDLNGTVTSWNHGAERLFGYRADEMIGQPVMRLIPPDRADEEWRILEKISRGETIETYETIRRRKDGAHIHVSLTISPLLDAKGNVIGASKIARDITGRIEQEAVLTQSRERLWQALQYQEAIISNMGEGLYTVNRQGLVVSMNHAAEKLFGWTKEELVGRKMHDVTHYKHPDGRPFLAEDCAGLQVVRSGVPLLNHEDVFIRKDGSFFDVVYSSSPIRSSGDEITGLVVVFHDVTEQKRAEQALRDRDRALTAANDELNQQRAGLAEANNELQSFSYSVSHDLRAPLRTIDAYVRIVEEDHAPLLSDEVRRCLGIIRKAAGQAGQLIDDLLEFSRLGRIGMDFRPTKMTELAREVAAELALMQPERTIDLTIGDLPLCNGDWRLLKLVWANLLSNAYKFTRTRPLAQVEIGWLPDDRQSEACVYYVKDNGVGFDMKYVHKLFGVFQRLHLKDQFEGTGVGLAIVQRIVQRHGGRVWAEGKVDGGATIFFSLRKATR
jgi:PAS domain S-box-containing protein